MLPAALGGTPAYPPAATRSGPRPALGGRLCCGGGGVPAGVLMFLMGDMEGGEP